MIATLFLALCSYSLSGQPALTALESVIRKLLQAMLQWQIVCPLWEAVGSVILKQWPEFQLPLSMNVCLQCCACYLMWASNWPLCHCWASEACHSSGVRDYWCIAGWLAASELAVLLWLRKLVWYAELESGHIKGPFLTIVGSSYTPKLWYSPQIT